MNNNAMCVSGIHIKQYANMARYVCCPPQKQQLVDIWNIVVHELECTKKQQSQPLSMLLSG